MTIKDELQYIIFGNEQISQSDNLKTVQTFLRRNAEISSGSQEQKLIKREEEKHLLNFADAHNLFYSGEMSERNFIAEGKAFFRV